MQLGSREGLAGPRRGSDLSRQLVRLAALISSEFPVTGTKSRVERALQACEGSGLDPEGWGLDKARGTKDTSNCQQMCV